LYILNPTADYHPMHTHFVPVQIIGKIPLKSDMFSTDFLALNRFSSDLGLTNCGQFPKIENYYNGGL